MQRPLRARRSWPPNVEFSASSSEISSYSWDHLMLWTVDDGLFKVVLFGTLCWNCSIILRQFSADMENHWTCLLLRSSAFFSPFVLFVHPVFFTNLLLVNLIHCKLLFQLCLVCTTYFYSLCRPCSNFNETRYNHQIQKSHLRELCTLFAVSTLFYCE